MRSGRIKPGGQRASPGRFKRPGLVELKEPSFAQYSQMLMVRRRKPNGVGTRRVTKHPS
jgi:hypothetical protein